MRQWALESKLISGSAEACAVAEVDMCWLYSVPPHKDRPLSCISCGIVAPLSV